MVIFTLILVDVELTESENWNFLKYGRIGNTLCNPYNIVMNNIITHIHHIFLIGVNFCGDLHLDASRFCLN